ncbi:MAG: TonB family protein [Kangiellaceae bacterium]|nr:TonB family protein [Kangiellaceae bacterium]
MQEFQTLAEIGNKSAQYNLGMMYLDGLGTKQDLVKAWAWIKLSDEDAQKEQELLANIEKHLVEDKKQEAEFYYNSIFGSFGKQALVSQLMPVFNDRVEEVRPNITPIKTVPPKYPATAQLKGIEGWVKLSFGLTADGSPTEIVVTDSYPKGVFDKETIKAVKQWQFEIVEEDLSQKMDYFIAYQFSTRSGFSRKIKNAIDQVEALANEGDFLAQYYYAKYAPIVFPKKKVNSTEWFYKAAQGGIADAQYEVALNLLEGKGCEQDKEKGINWLLKSASGNLGRSQFKLAELFLEMDNQEKGVFWLTKAVYAKDKEIAYELAKFLDESSFQQFDSKTVLEQLQLVDEKAIDTPIRLYELYAKTYADLGNYEEAVDYQKKANKLMRKISKVTDEMTQKLELYKSNNKS